VTRLQKLLAIFGGLAVVGAIIDQHRDLPARPPEAQQLAEQATAPQRGQCNELTADRRLNMDAAALINAPPSSSGAMFLGGPGGYGYACHVIDLICPGQFTDFRGYTVSCDQQSYLYDLKDYGGKWLVIPRARDRR
jgi:hypothetical protein